MPSSFRSHLLGWSVLFKKVKDQGSLGVPAEFPPEKWSTPKNWNTATSWLRVAFRSWNFAEICTFGTLIFLYDFFPFCIFYRLEEIFYRLELKEFRLWNSLVYEVSTIYIPIEIWKWTWLKWLLQAFWV